MIDTPLSEGGIIGTAIGMALYGLVPGPEIQFADFIYPALRPDRVSELAKYRYRSGGEYRAEAGDPHAGRRRHPRRPLPLAVARGAVHPRRGPQGRVPGEPGRRQGPAPRLDPRSGSGAVLRAEAHLPRGQGRRARGRATRSRSARPRSCKPGAHVTLVIAWGAMLYEALDAREPGRARRASTCEVHRPAHAVAARHRHDHRASVKKTGRVVVVHEAPKSCGLGARARRADQREGVPAPRGAAAARHGLRHAVPVHARERVPAARAPHPAGDPGDREVLR